MNGTLIKWDATVVGEHPPLGRWMRNGKAVKVTSHQPNKWLQRFAGLVGFYWELGVDAKSMPGCLEVIEFGPDSAPKVTFKRDS
jgi:hypothetical protein